MLIECGMDLGSEKCNGAAERFWWINAKPHVLGICPTRNVFESFYCVR